MTNKSVKSDEVYKLTGKNSTSNAGRRCFRKIFIINDLNSNTSVLSVVDFLQIDALQAWYIAQKDIDLARITGQHSGQFLGAVPY